MCTVKCHVCNSLYTLSFQLLTLTFNFHFSCSIHAPVVCHCHSQQKKGVNTKNCNCSGSQKLQETQPSLTNRTTHRAICNGTADLRKTRPSLTMCHHTKLGSSTSNGVKTKRGEPQKWGALGLRPLEGEAWLTPRNTSALYVLLPCIKGCRDK